MTSSHDFTQECKENVFSGIGISKEDAKKLISIDDEFLGDLASASNEITRL